MKKHVTFLTIIIFSVKIANCQISKQLMPVNPDIIKYYEQKKKTKKSAKLQTETTGYIPPYVQLPEYYETPKSTQSYIVGIPEKFDLRDNQLVTTVKNQGSGNFGGNCWAFSSLGSIESCWKNVLSTMDATDLSEHHMATCHGYSWKFGEGGNEYFPMAYLTKLKGPVKESQVPYNPDDTSTHHCNSSYPPVAYFPETRWIYNNPALTKKMIMQYGAVSTNIHWDPTYYDASIYTFYSNDRNGPNHAVALIGWDDNIKTKHGTGAWIAKNSWSNSWAKDGFFYIAYGDWHILKPASFYPSLIPISTFDTLMTKTDIGVVSFFGYTNDYAYALLKFNALSAKNIRKIGTFLPRTGSILTIDVYDSQNDTVGNSLIHFESEPAICPGFYTYNVPVAVDGEFYVKLRYYTPGLTRPIPVEIKAEILGEMYADPVIQPSGSQWVSEDGNEWKALGSDIKDWEANIVAHVYATSSELPVAYFKANKKQVCAGSTITFTNQSIGNITTYEWNFGDDVTPSTATGPGPHTITVPVSAANGIHYAQLKVTGPEGTDTYTYTYTVENRLTVLIGAPDYIKVRDTAKLTAITDAEEYRWFPAEGLSDTISKEVYFNSRETGLHKITLTARQGNCTGTYTINLSVKQPPINDDACNAILLNKGENGPFTNRGATVEPNEPHPADTSCYDELSWCNEGGLQNSVWFKVIGPATGKMSIDTRGMDTQIAVYKSDTCTNIKQSDLVAANDDYYVTEPYAAAIYEMDVIPGKTYWIQIDGSAGGDEGEFYITINDGPLGESQSFPVSIGEINHEPSISIFPNPNNGRFRINNLKTTNNHIYIYTPEGKLIEHHTTNDNVWEYNHAYLKPGIYIIKIQNNFENYVLKIMVQ